MSTMPQTAAAATLGGMRTFAERYPRLPLEQLTQLKAAGVMPSDVERFRRAGFTHLDVDELVQTKTLGLNPGEMRASRDDP
jgi:hypothetical protein